MTTDHFNLDEWIEHGPIAVRTRSLLLAAKVAATVETLPKSVAALMIEGDPVEYMCQAVFRQRVGETVAP